jgi:hypothetical protein
VRRAWQGRYPKIGGSQWRNFGHLPRASGATVIGRRVSSAQSRCGDATADRSGGEDGHGNRTEDHCRRLGAAAGSPKTIATAKFHSPRLSKPAHVLLQQMTVSHRIA